jgi:hypothetical protein
MIELSIVQRENQVNINKRRNHTRNEALLTPESHGELGAVPRLRLLGACCTIPAVLAKYCTKPAGKFGAHLSLDSSLVSFAPITYLDEFSRGLEVSSSPKSNLSMTVFLVRWKLMRNSTVRLLCMRETMKNTILALQQISIALLSLDNSAENLLIICRASMLNWNLRVYKLSFFKDLNFVNFVVPRLHRSRAPSTALNSICT